jgi:epoxyqueuosine reductase
MLRLLWNSMHFGGSAMSELFEKIQNITNQFGADYLGVADLEPEHVKAAVLEQGGEMLKPFTRCITVGITMFDSIVDLLPGGREDRAVTVSYRHHGYGVLNSRLDLIASVIASAVQRQGFRAMPMPASERYDDEKIRAVFSHKLGAAQAGLGWIGKSCMLITPEHGPRVRWVSVLTDAPLAPTGSPIGQRCGSCMECVNICPAQAYTGRNYAEGEPRELRFDAGKCQDYLEIKATTPGKICGLCVYACPYGKKT